MRITQDIAAQLSTKHMGVLNQTQLEGLTNLLVEFAETLQQNPKRKVTLSNAPVHYTSYHYRMTACE